MAQVIKLGQATLDVPDTEAMLAYYTETLGLAVVERDGQHAVYLGHGTNHHSVALQKGSAARLRQLAFQLDGRQSLQEVASQFQAEGIASELLHDPQPGIGEALQLTDPDGTTLLLYTQIEQRSHGYPEKGIVPNKLGHVARCVQNIGTMVEFYQRLLGFRVSDWMGDFFVFLRCSPDHHSINLVQSKHHKMHHIAFELRDWSHIQTAVDLLARRDIPLIWGPGRHGLGHNIFTYHHDPAGNIVELFTELDVMLDEQLGYFEPRPWHGDFPQRPKVWEPGPTVANLWGIMPPADFLD